MLGTKSKHIKYAQIASKNNPFVFECGAQIDDVTIAYETYGKLNKNKSNVILMVHAFSGDSHVSSHPDEAEIPGWWEGFIGPGLIFDTDKYFIICSNVIGGCMGSTGPSSVNPATNKQYGINFPEITIKDMVNGQKRLLDTLGISKLNSVVGGSMGGMQVLEWTLSYPDIMDSAIAIATTSKLSAQGIAFNEVGRRAIINDPKWKRGDYSFDDPPKMGLAIARMIGHITYLSDDSMRERFGRNHCSKERSNIYSDLSGLGNINLKPEFEVESYLNYKGYSFTRRFDANTYLYLTKAIDYFDLEAEYGSLFNAFSHVKCKYLIMTITGDWLYPVYQGKQILQALQANGKDVVYCEMDSDYGHDAFLLEYDKVEPVIRPFLEGVYEEKINGQKELQDNATPVSNISSS